MKLGVMYASDMQCALCKLESLQSRAHWLLLICSFQFRSAARAAPDRHSQSPTLLPLPTLAVLIIV